MSAPPIVVDVDGGPGSAAALMFAVQEAELRKTKVLAIFCWPTSGSRDDSSPRCVTHEDAADILERAVSEATRHEPRSVPIVQQVRASVPVLVVPATALRHNELDIQTEINLHQSELSR